MSSHATAPTRPRYGEYAAIVSVITLGLIGVIYFSGIVALPFMFYLGIFLMAVGLYTLVFALMYRSVLRGADRNYYLGWGYLLAASGFALALTLVTENLLLNLSIVLIGAAVIAIIIARS